MRTFARRTAVLASALLATTGAGVAYAAWTSNGTGTGTAAAGSAQVLTTITLEGTAVAAGGLLYPGGTGDVVVKVHNPNPYPVRLTSIAPNGAVTAVAGTGAGTCTTTGVTFDGATWSDDSHVVGANGDVKFKLADTAHMANTSDDGCQGATFSVPVTIAGASNA
jgi:hypothetical protein